MTKFVLVVGNAFDGMCIHGPFDTSEDAGDCGQIHFRYKDWRIVPIKVIDSGPEDFMHADHCPAKYVDDGDCSCVVWPNKQGGKYPNYDPAPFVQI